MAPLALLGIAVFVFLGGEVVKLLWNGLLPPLFGWREISFWQALGLLVLTRILFGGWHGRGVGRSHMRRRIAGRMANRMGDRWDRMTPEEREGFRQRLRDRCGFDSDHSGVM